MIAASLTVFVLGSIVTLQRGVQGVLRGVARTDNAIVLSRGVSAEDRSFIPRNLLAQIESSLGVSTLATGELVQPRAFMVRGNWMLLALRGTTATSRALRPYVTVINGREPRPGTNEAMVGSALSPLLKSQSALEFHPGHNIDIVGTFSSGGSSHESEIWLDVDFLRDIFKIDRVSSVTLRLTEPEQLAQLNEQLARIHDVDLEAKRESDYFSQLSRGFASLFGGIGAVVAFVLAVGAISATTTTMYGLIAARRREIGVFRALGFDRRAILFSFLLESLMLSLTGGIIGLGFMFILPFVTFDIPDAIGLTRVLRFDLRPIDIPLVLAASITMGLMAGIFPAINAARVSPSEAIRQ
ncbi:MAG: ABC transporter permease [Deltaproteobacteria bacterium]|nr:ABC transporter permease [Deltaproteobacteria bacterium]